MQTWSIPILLLPLVCFSFFSPPFFILCIGDWKAFGWGWRLNYHVGTQRNMPCTVVTDPLCYPMVILKCSYLHPHLPWQNFQAMEHLGCKFGDPALCDWSTASLVTQNICFGCYSLLWVSGQTEQATSSLLTFPYGAIHHHYTSDLLDGMLTFRLASLRTFEN